ncbi:MAG: hypothetical protein EBX92_07645 [Actinobacteria bacterium]|nr:hypothetical protein [Actinomycetota bacterium]
MKHLAPKIRKQARANKRFNMNVSPSKENILKRIRQALTQETPIPFPQREVSADPVVHPLKQDIEVEFAERFTALEGKFIYCINRQELAFQLGSLIRKMDWEKVYCVEEKLKDLIIPVIGDRLYNEDLSKADVSITGCECLVARTGSIVLSSAQTEGRTASVYAPIHVCSTCPRRRMTRISMSFSRESELGRCYCIILITHSHRRWLNSSTSRRETLKLWLSSKPFIAHRATLPLCVRLLKRLRMANKFLP